MHPIDADATPEFSLDDIPVAACILDADGAVVSACNGVFRSILGLSRPAPYRIADLLAAHEVGRLADLAAAGMLADDRGTWDIRSGDGVKHPFAFRCQRRADGRHLVLLEDRTASRRLSEALHESERRWANTSANVPGAVFRYIMHADGRSSVVYMSDGCRDLWEIESAAIVQDATPMWAQVLPEDLPAMAASVQRSAETLDTWDHRWRIRTPSGRVKWLHGRGRPFRQGDEVVWDSLILDITAEVEGAQQRAALLRDLEASRRLEAIGRLAGGVAHDFNNLLTVMMMGLDALGDDVVADGEAAGELLRVREAANRAAGLVKQLLAFARERSGPTGTVQARRALEALVPVIERLVPAGVVLHVTAATSQWSVGLSEAELDQIVTNLVVNAARATPSGGRIEVVVRDRPGGEEGEEGRDCVELLVRDTGQGMDPMVRDRIFEPFFTTRPGEGTGLGLATVYGLVVGSHGTVAVESEPGQGTAFRVRLPRSEPSADPKPEARSATPAHGERVLVVDDEDGVLRSTVAALRSMGYDAHGVASGALALEYLAAHGAATQALLSDVVMPELGGPELLALVHERWPHIRTMLMSGYAGTGFGITGADLPHVPMLPKPFSRAKLSVVLQDLLAR